MLRLCSPARAIPALSRIRDKGRLAEGARPPDLSIHRTIRGAAAGRAGAGARFCPAAGGTASGNAPLY